MKKILCLFFALLFLLAGCEQAECVQTEFLMDTVCSVRVKQKHAQQAVQDTFLLLREMDRRLSRTNPKGEIFALNRDGEAVLSEDAARVVEAGLVFGVLSQGKFDISIAPVKALWDFTNGVCPEESALQKALTYVDYQKVTLSGQKVTMEKGMELDLGGIGKGYCVDQAAAFLREKGIKNALIDLGGNVACLGENGTMRWRVALRDPFGEATDVMGVFTLHDGDTVTTSGTYERCFTKDGVTYHHILDPKTGLSAQTDLVSATILCNSALSGDALSTICILLGSEEGMALIEKLPDVEALLVKADQSVLFSSGFAKGTVNYEEIK